MFSVNEIQKMGLRFWDGFRIFVDINKSVDFNYMHAFELFKKLKEQKNLTAAEITFGKSVLKYTQDNPSLIDEIKSLSNIEDKDIIEIKFIYDKLLLISKEDWKRIFDIATQTKLFSYNELANVKTVQLAISKKENIKEQSIFKAYESLLKLKKFGISII